MGAPRLSPGVRETLSALADAALPSCTAQDGTIDRKRLAATILDGLGGNPPARAQLAKEGTALAVNSFVADRFRDARNRVTVGGRKTTLREVYSVPIGKGQWATKPIDELTPDDLSAIEAQIQREAMGRLRAARDIRTLRGFVANPGTAQITLDDGEFAEEMNDAEE